jgi:spoIIIJ-associated protein
MDNNIEKRKLPKNVEIEGGTVEEAIKKALEMFNVSRDQIVVKVVCEEKRGLFGMEGAKPAKIKVSFKEKNKNP